MTCTSFPFIYHYHIAHLPASLRLRMIHVQDLIVHRLVNILISLYREQILIWYFVSMH